MILRQTIGLNSVWIGHNSRDWRRNADSMTNIHPSGSQWEITIPMTYAYGGTTVRNDYFDTKELELAFNQVKMTGDQEKALKKVFDYVES